MYTLMHKVLNRDWSNLSNLLIFGKKSKIANPLHITPPNINFYAIYSNDVTNKWVWLTAWQCWWGSEGGVAHAESAVLLPGRCPDQYDTGSAHLELRQKRECGRMTS